ncbi:hypothetical protein MLPF_1347 [Mycobacterium lepromatosis]|nr:hypothetical protein MLPF_1347 [Mycobacterium lepromatosis]
MPLISDPPLYAIRSESFRVESVKLTKSNCRTLAAGTDIFIFRLPSHHDGRNTVRWIC